MLSYILITAARNEEAFLPTVIESVAAQTHRPLRWIIINDGSTDATEDIITRSAAQHPWIELQNAAPRADRSFAGKANCFNDAFRTLGDLPFDLVGNLDADISLPPDFYAFLTSRFAEDPCLGLAGAPFVEEGRTYDFRFSSIEHVSGATQLFRRECFEQIGGYTPLEGGGIDVVAVLTARMKGWRTRTFTEVVSHHHRLMSSANYGSRFTANMKLGQRAYRMGYHPLWQVFRSVYQMSRPPYVSGGLALLLGYTSAALRRLPRPIPPELITFQRRDQMRRLRAFFQSLRPGRAAPTPAMASFSRD